jgi:hypothetical protein
MLELDSPQVAVRLAIVRFTLVLSLVQNHFSLLPTGIYSTETQAKPPVHPKSAA